MEGTIGEVRLFGGDFAPEGWAFCNGQLMAIQSNTSLYSIIGVMYGGDNRSTFQLPDLRGRTVIGANYPYLENNEWKWRYPLGESGGRQGFTLSEKQIPKHTHVVTEGHAQLYGSSATANNNNPKNKVLASGTNHSIYVKEENPEFEMGEGQAKVDTFNLEFAGKFVGINPIQPYAACHFIICVEGNYPSND